MRTTFLCGLLSLLLPGLAGAAGGRLIDPGIGQITYHALAPTSFDFARAVGAVIQVNPSSVADLPAMAVIAAADYDTLAARRTLAPITHALLDRGISSEEFAELTRERQLQVLREAHAEAIKLVRQEAVTLMVQSGTPGAHAADLMNAVSGLRELEAHFGAYLPAEDREAVTAARARVDRRLTDARYGVATRKAQRMAEELGLPARGSAEAVALDQKVSGRLVVEAKEASVALAVSNLGEERELALAALKTLALDSGDARVQRAVLDGLAGREEAVETIEEIALGTPFETVRLIAVRLLLERVSAHKGARFTDADFPDFERDLASVETVLVGGKSARAMVVAVEAMEAMLLDNRSSFQRAKLAESVARVRAWASESKIRGEKSLKVPIVPVTGWTLLGLDRENIRRSAKRSLFGQLADGFANHPKGGFLSFAGLGATGAMLAAAGLPWLAVAGVLLIGALTAVKGIWTDHSMAAAIHVALLGAFLTSATAAAGAGPMALAVLGAGAAGSSAVAMKSFRADKPFRGHVLSTAVLALAALVLGYLKSNGSL